METPICPICSRPLGSPEHISRHHLIPKSKGGTHGEIITIHNICHQKIHSVFTEKELKDQYHTVEALLGNEQMQKFVKWGVEKTP